MVVLPKLSNRRQFNSYTLAACYFICRQQILRTFDVRKYFIHEKILVGTVNSMYVFLVAGAEKSHQL